MLTPQLPGAPVAYGDTSGVAAVVLGVAGDEDSVAPTVLALSVTAMFEALASTKNEGRAGCSEG
jgi:hypothetical protein